ncbi:MAG: N-acetylmuramoyl-L-alanine amidase [Magnetococcales bacterium]|nr:N-acetylmuramoyl-L-alanine amidase [Magnetococcales bacterium]
MPLLILYSNPCFAFAGNESGLGVAIDIGHTSSAVGARSARGRGEFYFNRAVGLHVLMELQRQGFERSFAIINPKSLYARTRMAHEKKADLLLSFHHDSAQSQFLEEWIHEGKKQRFSDRFRGFSLLISTKNPRFRESLRLATMIGRHLKREGFEPTLHHAADIPGERHALFNARLGIYCYDDLVVLRTASMPAVLVEVGVIINRQEEVILSREETRNKVARAIVLSLREYQEWGGKRR